MGWPWAIGGAPGQLTLVHFLGHAETTGKGGKELFEKHCSACHVLNKDRMDHASADFTDDKQARPHRSTITGAAKLGDHVADETLDR